MEVGHDVKAALSIYMQTTDVIEYTRTLKNTKVSLLSLEEPNGSNIFHDIADCVVKENYLLQYLEVLASEFTDRYFEDSSEMIKTMLNKPAGREKQTPLMLAVKHNRKVILNQKLLKDFVKLGGDVNIKDVYGHNLVHISSMCGFECILVYLCTELRISFKDTDINGRTPLHLSALENQSSTGMQLIIWTKDLNQQDTEGFTSMHLAVLSQSYKIVRNLIIRGADINIKDNKGESALDIAMSRGDTSIIKLLVYFI